VFEKVGVNPNCDARNKSMDYVVVSVMERSQPKGFKAKMRVRKLKSGVYL
jgi:hypothetical protein